MEIRGRHPVNGRVENLVPRQRYRSPWPIFLMALFLLGFETTAGAFNTSTIVDINAPLASSAQLTITPSSINFPNADPDTVPSIPANGNPVQVTANAQTNGNKTVTLDVIARGDLVSGGDAIAISNVRWTATGDGFVAGTMSKTAPQTAGSWQRSGNRTGTFSFFLNNNWFYATGNYTQTVTYTLTSP
jgi:hypothetical protein